MGGVWKYPFFSFLFIVSFFRHWSFTSGFAGLQLVVHSVVYAGRDGLMNRVGGVYINRTGWDERIKLRNVTFIP